MQYDSSEKDQKKSYYNGIFISILILIDLHYPYSNDCIAAV